MSISDTSGESRSRPDRASRLRATRSIEPDRSEPDFDWAAIGFDPGAGGGSSPSPPRTPPPPRPDQVGLDPGIVTPSPAQERPCAQWVIWEAWYTMHDERVCPECGPLHGREFQRGLGPQPPLHSGCRCFRREVHRECVARRADGP